MKKNTNIGFIGIGVMGAPMSAHLARAGYTLCLHDIDSRNADKIAAEFETVTVAASPKEVAERCDIVITMLPSGKYVKEIALGDNGLIHGFKPGALLLDTSSSEPWLTIETAGALAVKNIDMVDAPVSGARAGADEAELVFMAGGSRDAIQRVTPLLQVMGKQIFHLGDVGAGHTMKCINNTITAMTFLATAEGMVLGKKAGLDPDTMVDVLNNSTGMSWISRTHIKQRIISRMFDDSFKLELMLKDIGIAMKLAADSGIFLPLSENGLDLWKQADDYAGQGGSVSELVRWVEHMTNTELTPGVGPA